MAQPAYSWTSLVQQPAYKTFTPTMPNASWPTWMTMQGNQVEQAKVNAYNTPLKAAYDAQLARAKMADQLTQELNTKSDEANAANEARYQQILAGYDAQGNQINSEFINAGAQGEKDINQKLRLDQAKNTQALVNSGMSGTTVLPSLNMQAGKNATDALARLREQLRLSKLGYLTANNSAKMNVMERRTDEGPNMANYMQLIQAMGNTTPQYV